MAVRRWVSRWKNEKLQTEFAYCACRPFVSGNILEYKYIPLFYENNESGTILECLKKSSVQEFDEASFSPSYMIATTIDDAKPLYINENRDIFSLIGNKVQALKLDIDYSTYLKSHPAESEFARSGEK